MVKHSPHKRWKGHDMMCNIHKLRGTGKAQRTPWSVLRQLGVKRRLTKGNLGE